MNPEQSAVSKTSSKVVENDYSNVLTQGKTQFLDFMFPMWDQFTNGVIVPSIFYQISLFYFIFQLFMFSFWISSSSVEDPDSNTGKLLIILHRVAFILPGDLGGTAGTAIFGVHLALFSLVLFLIVFNALYYIKMRSFVKWLMYPSKFMIEIIPLISIFPTAALVGEYFWYSQTSQSQSFAYTAMVLSAIVFLFQVFIFSYTGEIIANSAFLSEDAFSTFDFRPTVMLGVVSPVLLILIYLFKVYERWTDYFIVLAHLGLVLFIGSHFFYLPFTQVKTNNIIISVLGTSVILDLLRLLTLVTPTPPDWVPLLIGLTSLVLLLIAVSYYNKKRIARISASLAYNQQKNASEEQSSDDYELITLNDTQKQERFRLLGLDTSIEKMYMYLHYGLANICDMFTDFSLIKYAVEQYSSTQMLAFCTRLTNYFPTELRLTNVFLMNLMKRRDLRPCDRFLIYQVHKIKILRQSSSSYASNLKLSEIKQTSQECESHMRYFWFRQDASIEYLQFLYKLMGSTRSRWEEVIRDYPNSVMHHEEYCTFLIECATDFETAVTIKHRAELIENGVNFSVDMCFRSLIHSFPNYLKRKVLDLKGNLVKSRQKRSSSQKSSETAPLSDVVDARMEEEIAKTIVNQSKLRLALQQATSSRKSSTFSNFSYISYVANILLLITSIVLYVVLKDIFQERALSTSLDMDQAYFRMYFMAATLFSVVRQQESAGVFDMSHGMDIIYQYESPQQYYFNMSLPLGNLIMNSNVKARDHYSSFLTAAPPEALSGSDTPLVFCSGDIQTEPRLSGLKEVLVYEFMIQSIISGDESLAFSSSEFCTLLSTYQHLSRDCDVLSNTILRWQITETERMRRMLVICTISIPIVLLLVVVVPVIVLYVLSQREVTSFASLLLSLDSETKTSASKPLRKSATDENSHIQEPHHEPHKRVTHLFALGGSYLLAIVLISMMIIIALLRNDSLQKESLHLHSSSLRAPLVTEAVVDLILNISNPSYLSLTGERARNLSTRANIPDGLPLPECTPHPPTGTLHDAVSCASTQQLIAMLPDVPPELANHILLAHLLPQLTSADVTLHQNIFIGERRYFTYISLSFAASILIPIFIITLTINARLSLDLSQAAIYALIRRLPPASVPPLLAYSSARNDEVLTLAASVVRNSPDAILTLSSSGIVETANPSSTTVLGLPPEQLLGQPIPLAPASRTRVESHLALMTNGHAPPFEDLVELDGGIQRHLTLVFGQGVIIAIIRDEGELAERRKLAEAAKIRSETLLFEILPRDIVSRINRGETEISFAVQNASVMFIDVAKFSEYAAGLNPSEVLAYLSALFSAMDTCLSKYPLLTKIKLVGDVYMCAGGLFGGEGHEEQIVKFGLDAIGAAEEVNVKFDAGLGVRVGANCGSIVAGVLGVERPTFDIIGDAINVAARLQSTCPVGRVQISQAMYEAIAGGGFALEQRGEVFLKGKGKVNAWLVRPQLSLIYQMSGSGIGSGIGYCMVPGSKESPSKNNKAA